MTTAYFDTAHVPADRPVRTSESRSSQTIAPALFDLLARKDDRLLRDIGLERQDALGADGIARAERLRNRAIWNL